MESILLKAEKRIIQGRKNWSLRAAGEIPAVVYGSDVASQAITVKAGEFSRLFRQAGESTLIDLIVDQEKPLKVLIQDVQYHPVQGDIIHADFRQVNLDKPIEATIQLNFVGEAPAVREAGGVLIKALEAVKVRCLPGQLVHEIKVDITPLKTFDDSIHLKDIVWPVGLEILADPQLTVAVVERPRSEAELASLEKAVVEDVTAVAVEKKGKEEAAEETETTEEAVGLAAEKK